MGISTFCPGLRNPEDSVACLYVYLIGCFVLSESMGDFFRDLDLKPLWLTSIGIMDTLFFLLQPAKSQGKDSDWPD